MSYYDRINNPARYLSAAVSGHRGNFNQLQRSGNSASHWGVAHLFACRVVCWQPTNNLSLLRSYLAVRNEIINECINGLIRGPNKSISELKEMTEVQLVRTHNPEGLGYTWAALATLLRGEAAEQSSQMYSDRPTRHQQQINFTGYVTSTEMQIGSSPPGGMSPISSAPSSAGYVEKSSTPLLEDATVRFISCFIRCVLNHAQPLDKKGPYATFRDERLTYKAVPDDNEWKGFQAIDDGGIQLTFPENEYRHIAIIEAKRDFQQIRDGVATVSDELLAQVVGEALALRISGAEPVKIQDVIVILAIKHYVRVLHIRISDRFLNRFAALSPADGDKTTFMPVDSTPWWDLTRESGRLIFVKHLLAMIKWADEM